MIGAELENAEIRTGLCSLEVQQWIRDKWKGLSTSDGDEKDGVSVHLTPFRHCIIKDFLNDHDLIQQLKRETFTLSYCLKNNDLYQYRQSTDLFNINSPAVNVFKAFLTNQCITWLENITGIKLKDKVSVTCSCYDDTDYLLCHDDQCEDRHIAFILYLNDDWCEDDGGALQLFALGEDLQPSKVLKSILPRFNSFVFFEVSQKSYHQVQEVFTLEKTRMTLNGWFHANCNVPTREPYSRPKELYYAPSLNVDELLFTVMFNHCYTDLNLQRELNKGFEEASEILLQNFLNNEFYERCCVALKDNTMKWIKVGPANHRNYEVADEVLDKGVLNLVQMMKSEQMFNLLGSITGLNLGKNAAGDTTQAAASQQSKCSCEIRKWKRGCYTLMSDDSLAGENVLDATLYINSEIQSREDYGGYTVYIAPEEDEELLSVYPHCNSLALTYREKGTTSFVKYINHRLDDCFYTVNLSYYE